MSNMEKTSNVTKLRGNDSNRFCNQFQSYSNPDVETNSMAFDSFSTTKQNNCMPGVISKPQQSKCGGRGIIMKQLLEESKNNSSNDFLMKSSKLDFSNSNIEKHFKQLKEENEKKLRKENEMKYKIKFNSTKNT